MSARELSSLAAELTGRGAMRLHRAPGLGSRWSRDFGRATRRAPGLVVEAGCEADVSRVLSLCSQRGVPVSLRGTAHSCNGASLSDGGLLLVNAWRHGASARGARDDRVLVSARQRWREVEAALNRRGRRVPVLADYLDLSVGGTLAVGGYGVDSIRHGALVDQVERLRLILPDGTPHWCAPDEDAELFRYGLAGLGLVGAIESAVLRTREDPRYTTLFSYAHVGLEEMVDSFGWMSEETGPEFFRALHSRGRFVSTYGVGSGTLSEALSARTPFPAGRPARRFVLPAYRRWRSRVVSAWSARFGRSRRLWCDYVLDLAGLRHFAAHLARLQDDDAFGGCLQSLYVLGIRRPAGRVSLPLEAGNTPGGGLRYGIGLYCMVPPGDGAALDRVREAQDDCLRVCTELGGRPYLYGAHQLDRKRLDALYGADLARLLELRDELDPHGVYQPGVLL